MTELAHSRPLVLILEDEALIALDLQDELQDAGCAVAGPLTSCSAALEWLGTATPTMAILDTALNDGPCSNVAAELSRREVPFLIYSGHQEKHHVLADLPHLAWIEKPAPPAVVVRACQQSLVASPKFLGEALNLR
ncbi:histidine kinase [Microvirga sp. HBU67558]|uniref:histidine kinase n=1 Tax=Microvirga TaxID=186650 RepID=UPI001B3746AF|nr:MULTISPECIES: histidine kinase [unclassified Microvirga]MBQ0819349.1 histidine kinase [Microvirga sp. HBU67558]